MVCGAKENHKRLQSRHFDNSSAAPAGGVTFIFPAAKICVTIARHYPEPVLSISRSNISLALAMCSRPFFQKCNLVGYAGSWAGVAYGEHASPWVGRARPCPRRREGAAACHVAARAAGARTRSGVRARPAATPRTGRARPALLNFVQVARHCS